MPRYSACQRFPGSTRMVSSPAMVPTTSSSAARSMALARNWAAPGGCAAPRDCPASAETINSASSRRARLCRPHAAHGAAVLGNDVHRAPESAPRTFTAPSSSRSRDRVAWVTSIPSAASSPPVPSGSCIACWHQLGDSRVPAPTSSRGRRRWSSSLLLQQPRQQRLLGMQPVLRLVPHRAGGPVDHLVGDLLPRCAGRHGARWCRPYRSRPAARR